jgi:hypothetical protein
MGVISKQQFDRMQDIQLLSELLILVLNGPQHRRDTIDANYELYRSPTGAAAKALDDAGEWLYLATQQLYEIFDQVNLQAYHFPSSSENDFYGLVGALRFRGLLTQPQMNALKAELRDVLSGFRAQVEEYIARVRSDQPPQVGEFSPLVEEYGRGFLGGQINSKQRREDRVGVWATVINEIVATLDPTHGFSETQRRLIWAKSVDKLCARCGLTVDWPDYHAGHKVPRARGGRTTVENGQVEHAVCNMSAGANDGTVAVNSELLEAADPPVG